MSLLSRSQIEKLSSIYADEAAMRAIQERIDNALKFHNVRHVFGLPRQERSKLKRLYDLNYIKAYNQMYEKLVGEQQ